MELVYFAIVNFFLFALVIGLIWMIAGAIPPEGQSTFLARLGVRAGEHLPMLIGLAVTIFGSYFVYRYFYPDVYECRLADGRTVNTDVNPKNAWIEVGQDKIPTSKVEECHPQVVTLLQRIARAFDGAKQRK